MTFRPPRGALGQLVEAAKLASSKRAPPPRPSSRKPGAFIDALRLSKRFPLICEVKRASPSAGALSLDADAATQADLYVKGGAACVSVLTEESRFGGSLDDLRAVRARVSVPLLRKDFIVNVQMVEEAAAAGADCVLLIAAALEPAYLLELADAASDLGLDVLLELIYERDLEVLGLRPFPLVGVNARDLETLQMDPLRFARLAPMIRAPERLLVAESGIHSVDDLRRYVDAGADAALVGESLMRAADPSAKVREFSEVR